MEMVRRKTRKAIGSRIKQAKVKTRTYKNEKARERGKQDKE